MKNESEPVRPPLVLIAQDQEWSARSLGSVLGPAGFAILRAYNGEQALDRARDVQPDALVIDFDLPDIPGLEICRRLRESGSLTANTAILLTSTSPVTQQRRLEAYDAGAWEILHFPPNSEELVLKLQTFIHAKLAADRAKEEALVDTSTGLYNMRGLLRRAAELGSEAGRYNRPLACIVFGPEFGATPAPEVDIDSPIADGVQGLARLLEAGGRGSDIVGRVGPHHFAVLAPETDPDGALRFAKRVLSSLDEMDEPEPGLFETANIRVGYSAVPDFREASIDPADLLVRATIALRNLQANGNGQRIGRYTSGENGAN